MRWLLSTLLVLLPLAAHGATEATLDWGDADTMTGTSDESDRIWLPEGKAGYLIDGDFDGGECDVIVVAENGQDYVYVTYDDDTNTHIGNINWYPSHYAQIKCRDATTNMTVYFMLYAQRVQLRGQWRYRDPYL